jgi:hypothetical protein
MNTRFNLSQYVNEQGQFLLDLDTPIGQHVKFDNGPEAYYYVTLIDNREFDQICCEQKTKPRDERRLTLVDPGQIKQFFSNGLQVSIFDPRQGKRIRKQYK